MTDEQRQARIHHHIYETCEGIAEHAERIVALEELVADLLRTCDHPGCDNCVNEWSCKQNLLGECVEVTERRDRARELGIEVEYE